MRSGELEERRSFWGQGTGEKWGTRREAGNLDGNRRGTKRKDQIREKLGNCPRAGGEEKRKKDTGNRGPGLSHDSQCRARKDEDETIGHIGGFGDWAAAWASLQQSASFPPTHRATWPSGHGPGMGSSGIER